jgi:LmbE family N-acetylglucosaminyl deacetylase
VKWGALSASLVVVLTLSGCAGVPGAGVPGAGAAVSASPDGVTTAPAASTPTPTPTPTPTVTEPPSRNTLTGEQIIALAQTCGGLTAADPATPGLPLRDLSQWAADAMQYFASTAQCDQLPVMVARDAARTDPEGMVFSSPLQFIDPPCATGTVVSFWAHYDDDLIFANPALQQAFDAGECLRTFFFTESDAGEGQSSYAANREVGIRAAYDVVRGSSGPWTDQTVVLRNGVTLTLSRPDGDGRISLLFLGLPDGGLQGSGYRNTGWESLPKVVTGDIAEIHSISSGQAVTLDQLQSTVVELVNSYGAAQVIAHLPGFAEGSGGDHPDHRSVGRIVAAPADAGLINGAIVQFAQGYPVARRPANVTGNDLSRKLGAFSVYAAHDPVISCSAASACLKVNNFGAWLQRQYLIPYAELVRDE